MHLRPPAKRLDSCEWPAAKPIFGIGYWELQIPLVRWRIFTALTDGNRIDKVVEGTTKCMNAIAADQGPSIQRRGIFDVNGNTGRLPSPFWFLIVVKGFVSAQSRNSSFRVATCSLARWIFSQELASSDPDNMDSKCAPRFVFIQ